jgi:tRNA A-37 threonylcarbamoyl transferase component Bud32
MNQLLYSKGFTVPKLLYINHAERLIFMEHVEGESTEKVLRRIMNSKNGEKKNDLGIITRVGEKFAEVHALNIGLGDTKPENILIEKNCEICLLDVEQASRDGDKAWDIAEFLYYAGHYVSPFVGIRSTEVIAKAFIEGYLKAGGNAKIVKEAGNPKYTKVFSVFTFPHIIFVISNICKKTVGLEE